MFSWIFPEITIVSFLYGIEWYENVIKNYSGVGAATLGFVKNLVY